MRHTFEITIEVSADYSTPEPGVNWPGGWTPEYISIPGFTDEQNEALWRSLRADMEESLIEYIEQESL